MIQRVHIAMAFGLTACAFQPGGAGTDTDADVVTTDGASIDAPAPTDGRPPTDSRPVDAAIDAANDDGLVRSAMLTAAGVLDGEAEEYGNSLLYALDLGAGGHRDFAIGYTPSMRAELRAGNDATYLYLFVEVFEAEPHSGDSPSTWQNDAVAFYFDTNNDRSGPYGADDHEVLVDYRPAYAIFPTMNGVDPTVESVRLNTAGGFTIESRFPRNALGSVPPGGRMGFGWGIYDDDGGGNADGYGLWYERPAARCATCCTLEDHAEPWCDTTMLGELAFN